MSADACPRFSYLLRCAVRIAYITAGAGSMYCGACQHDAALFTALTAAGHDLLAIPLYTPLRTDLPPHCAMSPIFMGGISLFLAQTFTMFRRLPPFIRRQLDRPALLRGISRLAIQTTPAKLGKMTVSMLAGAEGPHANEIERLVTFLRRDFPPDIINLGNVLLASLATPLRAALKVPIVATLQGEEAFIDGLPEPYRGQAMTYLRRHASSIDRFVSCSAEHVAALAAWLDMPRERFTVIPTGIDSGPFTRPEPRAASIAPAPADEETSGPAVLGYLSSIRHEKGLDILIDALRQLVHEPGRPVRLAIAGQILDRRYWRTIQETITRHNLKSLVTFHGELNLSTKVQFLRACDLFVMPTRLHEQRALAAMEALAAGVPVVASRRGVLQELLDHTEGGVTFTPGDPAALAQAIQRLLADPHARRTHAANGPPAIARDYSPEALAQRTAAEYHALLQGEFARA
jgi:glycosyltransferase involved in cell wall biosynthesis